MPINEIGPLFQGVTPGDLGLPEKFDSWRDGQLLAIDRSLESPARFVSHAMPTGTGKSATYMGAALYHGGRAAMLTSTKGLQDQLQDDFASTGLVTAKGKANFRCSTRMDWTCEQGSHCDCSCFKENNGCPYRNQLAAALDSKLVCANYAYWASMNKFGEGLGDFDLLILDEAHDTPDIVSGFCSIELTDEDIQGKLRGEWPKQPLYIAGWSKWAGTMQRRADAYYDQCARRAKRSRQIEDAREAIRAQYLAAKIQACCNISGTDWVVEPKMKWGRDEGTIGWKLEPIWPMEYAEAVLFRSIPKVILFSATMSKATLRLLGMRPGTFEHYEYASPFPAERSPIYHIPTVKLNHKSGPEDYFLLLERVDEIIGSRLDRKGIIHTTSYERASRIIQGSQYSGHMLTHTNQPGQAMRTFHQFREMPAPTILVSPSMTTGYDFPHDACEYQIIVKAPYPDLRSKVMQKRMEADSNFPAYAMSQTLVQACGRGMRSKTDQCETFILDDVVHNTIKRSGDLFPQWWKRLYRQVSKVPKAPPPLAV